MHYPPIYPLIRKAHKCAPIFLIIMTLSGRPYITGDFWVISENFMSAFMRGVLKDDIEMFRLHTWFDWYNGWTRGHVMRLVDGGDRCLNPVASRASMAGISPPCTPAYPLVAKLMIHGTQRLPWVPLLTAPGECNIDRRPLLRLRTDVVVVKIFGLQTSMLQRI